MSCNNCKNTDHSGSNSHGLFHTQVDFTHYMNLIASNQMFNLELSELKKDLCLCNKENVELKAENKELNDENEKLKEEVKFNNENKNLKETINELKDKNGKLEREVRKLNDKNINLNAEVTELRNKINSLEKENTGLKSVNCESIKKELTTAQGRILDLLTKLGNLKTQIENTKPTENDLKKIKDAIRNKQFDAPTPG